MKKILPLLLLLIVSCTQLHPKEINETSPINNTTPILNKSFEINQEDLQLFKELIEKRYSNQYFIQYDVTENVGKKVYVSIRKLYWKDKDNFRVDTQIGNSTFSQFIVEGKTTFCQNNECSAQETVQDELGIIFDRVIQETWPYKFEKLGNRIVEDIDTTCFKIYTSAGSINTCMEENGLPLYTKIIFSNGLIISNAEKIEYSIPEGILNI